MDALEQLASALAGRYEIERELGGGGMSRVFLATDTRLERQVVVKVLSAELAFGINTERFAREIKLAAQLQEPHIVPVHADGVTTNGLPYFIMPFVRGASLRKRMNDGPVPTVDAIGILRDVAKALAYAHARSVVHRDIKPENILLHEGTAVVTDFGIAKALAAAKRSDGANDETLTELGTSLGTPAYMAPEQVSGDEVDVRADLYAWGVVAYELLAGRHPFAGKTSAQQLLAAHVAETPALLSTGEVPRAIRDLVMRCLEKDPAVRPTSATDLIQTLETARSHGAPTRLAAWAGATLVATAAIAIALYVNSRNGPPAAEASTPTMLAVLPFEHEGPDDQAPFTNGLTDALTAKLGALPGLAVIDRQSASQYRRTTKPARQIGGELGVPYLVQGVVRWARTPAGAWRAQVTPTLVDAAKGITKWTGEPVLITPEDPFSAQASIAQRVAEALEVQLRPVDRAALARRQTGNPEAFAAYQRGRALTDAYEGAGSSAAVMQQAIAQFERAISLDSSFAAAWSALVGSRMQLAINAPGDREADRRMRLAMDAAAAHIPDDPLLLQDIAYRKLFFDRDTVGVDDLVSRALAAAGNDARVLGFSALHVAYRQQRYDSAYVLAARAARLDPRSPVAMSAAIALATFLRRWPDARNYADQLILLDSASSQGWWSRAQIELYIGDTVALARELSRGLAHVSRATPTLLSYLAYAGSSDARHFVSLSMADARPARLADTVVAYYGAKADAFARLGNDAAARAQYDSIRAMLSGRTLSGFFEAGMLFRLAHAQAVLGQMAPARETMDRAFRVARSSSARANLFDVVEPDVIAATYARLGEPEKAVAWLESIVKDRGASWTARGLANRPKLLLLRGTPAYERFLRDGGRGQP